MSIQQTFLDKTMQGSVCSKVAVKESPTKNGGKNKNLWETDSNESSGDENGEIGITDLEKVKQRSEELLDQEKGRAICKLINMKAELEQEKLRNQGILLRGIDNCSDVTCKGVSLFWSTRSVTFFLYFNKQRVQPFKSLSSDGFVVNTL